ncbi:hypothetical protein AKJ09_07352 [Labilithrix luteola]|uniref:Uncharacterized protein n=1 Tax=Labilithrix luteola TaxID=1391654 RepID=A0A0K1Q4M1_9BACT|nr:hypothetical protein [Labilithrix luteola]AKV00689.1 hypothetical protein AKJ09_07352 [Labilithrix luteola]
MLRIGGRFFDDSGKPVLVIENSAIQLNVENWDVTLEGEHLRIWSALRKPVLDLELGPPALRVHLLRTVYQGVDVKIAPDIVQLGANQLRVASGSGLFIGCVSCVSGSSEAIILGDPPGGRDKVVLKENAQAEFIRSTIMGGLRAVGHGEIKFDSCTFHGSRSLEAKRMRLSPGWAFDAVTVAGGGKTARIRRSSVQALWSSSSWPGVLERHPSLFITTHVLMFGHAFPSEVPQVAVELRDILLEIKRLRVELPKIVDAAEREGVDARERATLRATATTFEALLHDDDVAALIYVAEQAAHAGTELTIT